jgi:16S rRNA (guanine966-N2)-methyltransferase
MRIISGRFKGQGLKTTSGPGYRPATSKVKEALFSMLEARGFCWPETRVADFYAGSGSLGIEALSRGAPQVVFVEKNRRAAQLIKDNLHKLGIPREQARVWTQDAVQAVRRPPGARIHLAFVDPPYKKGLLMPFLHELLSSSWLHPEALIAAEVESEHDVPDDAIQGLEELVNRTYGQTRVYLWIAKTSRLPSTQEPSTP